MSRLDIPWINFVCLACDSIPRHFVVGCEGHWFSEMLGHVTHMGPDACTEMLSTLVVDSTLRITGIIHLAFVISSKERSMRKYWRWELGR